MNRTSLLQAPGVLLFIGLSLGGILAFGTRVASQPDATANPAALVFTDALAPPEPRDAMGSKMAAPVAAFPDAVTPGIEPLAGRPAAAQATRIEGLREERNSLQEQNEVLRRNLGDALMDVYDLSSDPQTSSGRFLRSDVAKGMPPTKRYVLGELLKDLPVELSAAEALALAESEEQFAETYYVAAALERTSGLSVRPRLLSPINYDDRKAWIRRKDEAANSPPDPVDVETALLARFASLVATLGIERLARSVDHELLRKFFGPHYESIFGG